MKSSVLSAFNALHGFHSEVVPSMHGHTLGEYCPSSGSLPTPWCSSGKGLRLPDLQARAASAAGPAHGQERRGLKQAQEGPRGLRGGPREGGPGAFRTGSQTANRFLERPSTMPPTGGTPTASVCSCPKPSGGGGVAASLFWVRRLRASAGLHLHSSASQPPKTLHPQPYRTITRTLTSPRLPPQRYSAGTVLSTPSGPPVPRRKSRSSWRGYEEKPYKAMPLCASFRRAL